MISRPAASVLALVLAGCAADRAAGPATGLTELHGSLDAVRTWFDDHAGTPRVVMLLSPV